MATAQVSLLEKVPLFKNTPAATLKELANSLVIVKAAAGEYIVRQGDIAKEMFFVVSGTVEIVGSEGKVFDESGAGSFFGEMGLIYNTPRTASVRAKTACELARLSKEDFDSVKAKTPEFYEQVKETADTRKKGILGILKVPFGRRARSNTGASPSSMATSPIISRENPLNRYDKQKVQQTLSPRSCEGELAPGSIPISVVEKVPIFKGASPTLLNEISRLLVAVKVSAMDFIVKQGQIAKEMFFVISGTVEIVGVDGKVFDESGAGSFFGEMGLIFNTPRTASVRAKTDCELARLNKDAFDSVKDKYPELFEKVKELADTRKKGVLGLLSTAVSRPFGSRIRSATTAHKSKEIDSKEPPKVSTSKDLRRDERKDSNDSLANSSDDNRDSNEQSRDDSPRTDDAAKGISTTTLAKVPIFQSTPEAGLKDIAKALVPIKLSPGEFAIRYGQIAKEMFFVISGFVQIMSQEGKVFDESGPGSFFGEMGLIFNTPRTASVCAKTDCELAVLNLEDFYNLIDTYPEIYAKVKELADSRKDKGVRGLLKNLTPIIPGGGSSRIRPTTGGWKHDVWSSKAKQKEEWPEVEEGQQSNMVDLEGCKKEYMKVELGQSGLTLDAITKPEEMALYDAEKDVLYFKDVLSKEKHIHYVGQDDSLGHIIISIEGSEHKDEASEFRAIIRTRQSDSRLLIHSQPGKTKKKCIIAMRPDLANISLNKVDDTDLALTIKLIQFEVQQIVKNFKFGVLYCKKDQVLEDEMFLNETGSEDFEEFLDFLGERIVLQGWKQFRGGLDVSTNTTGTHSVYTQHSGMEVMFHVSTLLPFTPGDQQQVERKRHLGNDIIMVIFVEGDQKINPVVFRTQFIQVWMLVKKVGSNPTRYKVEMVNKAGVPPYKPRLPLMELEKNTTSRDILLAKLINAERAALSGPEFKTKNVRTRGEYLKRLVEDAKTKTSK